MSSERFQEIEAILEEHFRGDECMTLRYRICNMYDHEIRALSRATGINLNELFEFQTRVKFEENV